MPEPARHLALVVDRLTHFYDSIPGFFWFEEAYRRLLATLPKDRPSTFVEIGCYCGRSTAWLAVELLNRRLPCTLHPIDAWDRPVDGREGTDNRAAFDRHLAPVAQLLGERFQPMAMPSLEAATYFAPESVDVVWIDGDHSYEAVTLDIVTWFKKLKPGGFMGGDDFMMAPVCKAVCEQFAPSGYILCHGWTTNPEPMCWPSWIARKA